MWLYNICIFIYVKCVALASVWYPKARLWREGRRNQPARMRAAVGSGDRIVWIHSASLGEFEQGLPLIESIRERFPEYKILLTFFSPSGYEIRKDFPLADYVFYLPADLPSQVREFLDIVKPEIAIFVKYEYWLNMLSELRRRGIRTYIVSSIFRPGSVFFRWWGALWRRALLAFDTIFVQNAESAELLAGLGFKNVIISGDTRFDRVAEIVRRAGRTAVLDRFCNGERIFIAGSTWPPDEALLLELIAENPSVKFIIAPHEMNEARIRAFCSSVECGVARYTGCTAEMTFDGVQVMVLDTVGVLASAYGYASWAYVGGGFGAGIHNILEAAAYGLPIAFGPKYQKFQEARDLVRLGAAASVADSSGLKRWFAPLRDDDSLRLSVSRVARAYSEQGCGAAATIMDAVFGAGRRVVEVEAEQEA